MSGYCFVLLAILGSCAACSIDPQKILTKQVLSSGADGDYGCSGSLKVSFGSGGDASCGNSLAKSGVQSAPSVMLDGVDSGASYVVAMVDPDAPSPSNPAMREWRHWLVGNVAGSSLAKGSLDGDALTSYNGPTPPAGTGAHRYVVQVYKQPVDKVDFAALDSSRGKWSVANFASQYQLQGPVAANFFLTSSDS